MSPIRPASVVSRFQLIQPIHFAPPNSFYYAQVSAGTGKFNAILDTGSADFWLADSSCDDSQCSGIALYDPSASSTSVSSNTPFQIVYGSGAVRGRLFSDTVSLAGYTVYNQTLAGVDQLAANTIQAPASGIMGMGFQTLTTSGATPFWEVLAETNKLPTQAFTFQLQRNALASPSALNPGGVFTLGQIDSNQYSGDITYVNLPSTRSGRAGYWAIPMDSIEVGGQTINTSEELAAIDTGTTLIGGPQSEVEQIFSSIQGARQVNLGGSSSSAEMGYYAYPCNANPSISITFGGRQFSINSQDFNAGALDTSGRYCLGAIFATDLGEGAPEWIVGDAFLKNVFSVYDYNNGTPRVGFANLRGSSAQNAPITTGAVPSGTAANSIPTSASGGQSSAPVGPPSISVDQSGATNTAIVGGSGLPAPVAAASNVGSTVSTNVHVIVNSKGGSSSSSHRRIGIRTGHTDCLAHTRRSRRPFVAQFVHATDTITSHFLVTAVFLSSPCLVTCVFHSHHRSITIAVPTALALDGRELAGQRQLRRVGADHCLGTQCLRNGRHSHHQCCSPRLDTLIVGHSSFALHLLALPIYHRVHTFLPPCSLDSKQGLNTMRVETTTYVHCENARMACINKEWYERIRGLRNDEKPKKKKKKEKWRWVEKVQATCISRKRPLLACCRR